MDLKQLYIENCEGFDEYMPDGSCRNGLRITLDGFQNALRKFSGQIEPRVKPFATEICIAHVKDGIEKYNRDAYKKCEEQLLKIIAILYHAQIDIKVKDIIPVEKEDVYWYKIKERTLDLGETLRITYWVDDLG